MHSTVCTISYQQWKVYFFIFHCIVHEVNVAYRYMNVKVPEHWKSDITCHESLAV